MNIRPYIILNGKNSQEIQGLMISELAPISKPQVRTQVETVDGRDGDIITPLGFSAYDKVITIGLTYGYDIDEIIEFFNSAGVVTFSNEPDKYYRYAIYEQIDFERLIRFKTAEVVLHVQPFKYSTTEETELFNISSGEDITVVNNGNTDSRPNLVIIGEGEVDFSLNGAQILSIDFGETEQPVIIDSEDMNAYAAESAIKKVIADIEAVQAGSGDPSPSNIREISGFTGVNITRTGKNLFNKDTITRDKILAWASGYYSNETGSYVSDFIPVKEGQRYVFNNVPISQCLAYDKDKRYILVYKSGEWVTPQSGSTFRETITIPEGVSYIRITRRATNMSGATIDDDIATMQIELGETPTAYEAYNASTYAISWQDQAGTVYGGEIDVTTGKIVLNKGHITYDGTENWTMRSDGSISTPIPIGLLSSDTSGITNMAVYDSGSTVAFGKFRYGATNFIVNLGTFADITEAKTYLTSHNLQFVYPLATPQEYQLTPTEINNLLGLNQIFADTGDVTVTYKSRGVLHTETGSVVSFETYTEDLQKGVLLNRMITGDYDKIRLQKGENTLTFTGNARQLVIDKYSRWI